MGSSGTEVQHGRKLTQCVSWGQREREERESQRLKLTGKLPPEDEHPIQCPIFQKGAQCFFFFKGGNTKKRKPPICTRDFWSDRL